MSNERKNTKTEDNITASDLEYIIDVNKKAVEIHVEVVKQQEQVLTALEEIEEKIDSLTEKQSEIDKNMFRLVIILSGAGIGTLFSIIQSFLHH
jgi:tetrahydromethanopterin S-methyltransferase subunit G